ncbi:hypothetical protein [Streptomyces sp. NPDC002851]
MNAKRRDHPKKASSRKCPVCAALGIALAAGAATAASAVAATPAAHVAIKAAAAQSSPTGSLNDVDNCLLTVQIPICV